MSCEKEFLVSDMVGKSVFTSDDMAVGEILQVIDQPDSEEDNVDVVCDIENDLFQVLVRLSTKVFPEIPEEFDILLSSQTLEEVIDSGIKVKLTIKDFQKLLE